MSQNHDSPTPQQREAMRQATAFAYGYSLVLWNRTGQDHYKAQAVRLEEDLKLFECFDVHGIELKEAFIDSWKNGRAKALSELEKIGI